MAAAPHGASGGPASTVTGYDASGHRTWSVPLDNPVRQVERADLDGDGHDESVVVAYGTGIDRAEGLGRLSEVVVVRNDGVVVAKAHPENLLPLPGSSRTPSC